MRKLALTLAALATAALAAGTVLAAEPPAQPLAVTNYGKKAPVTFDHAKHSGEGFSCVACHHNEADGKYKCGECHKLETEGKAPKIQDAFHGKETGKCWSCHRAEDAAHKLKCNDCHRE